MFTRLRGLQSHTHTEAQTGTLLIWSSPLGGFKNHHSLLIIVTFQCYTPLEKLFYCLIHERRGKKAQNPDHLLARCRHIADLGYVGTVEKKQKKGSQVRQRTRECESNM